MIYYFPTLYVIYRSFLNSTILAKSKWPKTALIFCLVSTVLYSLYLLGLWFIKLISEFQSFAYLSPSMIWAIVLMGLLITLTVSNAISSLNILFKSKDLVLINSSPISYTTFFIGKFFQVLISSSWISFCVLLPLGVIFSESTDNGFLYYLLGSLALIPFFLFTTSIGMILGLLFSFLVSFIGVVYIVLALALLTLGVGYILVYGISSDLITLKNMLNIVLVATSNEVRWMPNYSISEIIGSLISGNYYELVPHYIYVYSLSLASFSLCYLLYGICYEKVFSSSLDSTGAKKSVLRKDVNYNVFLPKFPGITIAIKDILVLLRDPAQTAQLLVLVVISLFYLYLLNVEKLLGIDYFSNNDGWFGSLMFVSNAMIESFVIIAFGSRLIYPSISLEGKTFWLVKSSPLSLLEIIISKYLIWTLILISFSFLFFSSATEVRPGAEHIKTFSYFFSTSLSIFVVGLALGFGCLFANFNWEHPSQLAASLGSFVYMLVAVVCVFINIRVLWELMKPAQNSYLGQILISNIYLSCLCLFLFNFLIVSVILYYGIQSLKNKI